MMKSVLKTAAVALGVAALSITSADAQFFNAGVQVTPSLPLGDLADGYDFGIGAKVSGNYYFNENVHAGLEIGYQTYGNDFGSFNTLPIAVNGAYHLDAENEFDVYFGTGVGLFLISQNIDGASDDQQPESQSLFGFTPRIGVSYELTDKLRLDGNISYRYVLGNEDTETRQGVEVTTGIADFSTLNINLGVTYMLWD